MDWGVLISAIISILTCSGVIWWLNPKAAKKKPELENDATEAATENTAVITMKEAIEEIRKSNEHFQEINDQRERKIQEMQTKIMDLEKDLLLATTYICGNCGCSYRFPPSRGSGEIWLQQLRKGEVSPSYDPIKCKIVDLNEQNKKG